MFPPKEFKTREFNEKDLEELAFSKKRHLSQNIFLMVIYFVLIVISLFVV